LSILSNEGGFAGVSATCTVGTADVESM
jgi:hypothetical protein